MKIKAIILLLAVLLHPYLVMAQSAVGNGVEAPLQKTEALHKKPRWSGITKTGVSIATTGAGCIVGAFISVNQKPAGSADDAGAAVLILGVLFVLIGGGLTIGGAISDNHAHHHITLVAPAHNQAGFAYNF